MDRKELRFRILFEYYNDFHSGYRKAPSKIKEIEVGSIEKHAAGIWLIEEGYVKGQILTQLGVDLPSIGRINSRGISFVESVMDGAFTEIRGRDENFDSLSKVDKIKRFAAECLGGQTTGQLCKATYEAIATLMEQASR